MVMYAIKSDIVGRFGEKEIIDLTDRAMTRTGSIDDTLLSTKIADAVAEINDYISCCFSLKEIQEYYNRTPSIFFPILKKWTCDITRYNLYDNIRLNVNSGEIDHQASRIYKDTIKSIKEKCNCGSLVASNGDSVYRISTSIMVEDRSCVKYQCCPGNDRRGLTNE